MENQKKGRIGKWAWRIFCLYVAYVGFSAIKGGFADLVAQQDERNFLLAPGTARGAQLTHLTPEIGFWKTWWDTAPFSWISGIGDLFGRVSLQGILITLLVIALVGALTWGWRLKKKYATS